MSQNHKTTFTLNIELNIVSASEIITTRKIFSSDYASTPCWRLLFLNLLLIFHHSPTLFWEFSTFESKIPSPYYRDQTKYFIDKIDNFLRKNLINTCPSWKFFFRTWSYLGVVARIFFWVRHYCGVILTYYTVSSYFRTSQSWDTVLEWAEFNVNITISKRSAIKKIFLRIWKHNEDLPAKLFQKYWPWNGVGSPRSPQTNSKHFPAILVAVSVRQALSRWLVVNW